MLGSASAVSFMQHTSELKLTFEIASKSTVIKKKKNPWLLATVIFWRLDIQLTWAIGASSVSEAQLLMCSQTSL